MAIGDDASDAASVKSLETAGSARTGRSQSIRASASNVKQPPRSSGPVGGRTVGKLRPKKPVILSASSAILDVCKAMANARTDSALLTGADGTLAGIVTTTDMTRRVVAQNLDLSTSVSHVMTQNPKYVSVDDDATEALIMMMDNHFRHLPVLGSDGGIVAVLDIAKCMYDAISKIEKVEASGKVVGGGKDAAVMEAFKNSMPTKGMSAEQAAVVQAVMGNMMTMFSGGGDSNSCCNLGAVLEKRNYDDIVLPTLTVREAAKSMAKIKKGVAVANEAGSLVGIFTLKDLNNRVLAKEIDPDTTLVQDVMTPNPESVEPEMTLLDALHLMHDQKYLHLPVVANGTAKGLVDAMDVMDASQGDGKGSDGWRSFWEQTMTIGDDASDAASVKSLETAKSALSSHASRLPIDRHSNAGKVPVKVPKLQLGALGLRRNDDMDEVGSQDLHGLDNYSGSPSIGSGTFDALFTFKVVDPTGNLHKVSAGSERLLLLKAQISDRLQCAPEAFDLRHIDEDGDEVLIGSNAALAETVDNARARGETFVRLIASMNKEDVKRAEIEKVKSTRVLQRTPREILEDAAGSRAVLFGGAAACAALLAVAGFVLIRKGRYY